MCIRFSFFQVSGLYGNFDGDSTNDYVFRNGTKLPSTSSNRAIFACAQSWRVNQNEAVFRYNEPNAQQWTYYNSESFNFVPIFIDEIKSDTTAITQQVFGGNSGLYQQANTTCFISQFDDNYYNCLVDVGYSGSLAAGNDSKSQSADIASSQQQLANAGPSLSNAPDSVNIRWNELNVISFLVTSGYTLNVTVLGAAIVTQSDNSSNSTNSTIISISDDIPTVQSTISIGGNVTNVTLTWTPSTLNITGFTVTVTDALGATVSWAPVTYYCTCISAAAVCLYPNASDTSSTSNSTNSTSNTSARVV